MSFWGRLTTVGKSTIVVLIVLIVAAAYQITIKPVLNQQPAPAPKPTKKVVSTAKPDSWAQDYNTFFNYNNQTVFVDNVKVYNLNSRNARAVYTVSVESRENSDWFRRRSTWRIGYEGTSKPATRVNSKRDGRQLLLTVTVAATSSRLISGAYLQVYMPRFNRRGKLLGRTPVRLALEVPDSHAGMAVRDNRGGL